MQAWSNNDEGKVAGSPTTAADSETGPSTDSPSRPTSAAPAAPSRPSSGTRPASGNEDRADSSDDPDAVQAIQSPKRLAEITIEDLDFVADTASTKWRKNKLIELDAGDSREALKTIKYTIPRKGAPLEDVAIEKGVRKLLKGMKEKRAVKLQAQMSTAARVFVDSDKETAFQTVIVSRNDLIKFYEEHDNSKVKDVDRIVKAYKTEELVTSLRKKYGAAPPTVEQVESIITSKQLTDFYWENDPARVETVERKLETYRTYDLMELLQEQYGVAPAPMPKTLLVRGAEIAKLSLEKEKEKTDAEAQAWEAYYEPSVDAYYYFNAETWQSVWEKPEGYIMVASEEELVATLKVQRWRQRCQAMRKVRAELKEEFKSWNSEYRGVIQEVDDERLRKEREVIQQQLDRRERADRALDLVNLRRKKAFEDADGDGVDGENEDDDELSEEVLLAMSPGEFVHYQMKRLMKKIKHWWLSRQGLANIPADGSDIDYLRDLKAWDYPDEQAGRRHREKMLFKGGDADVWNTTIAEMGEMGVGMSLYFIFLKKLCWFFFLASILALPALALNWGGRGIIQELADPMMLVYTTVANQGLHMDNVELGYCLENEAICNGTTRNVYGMEVPSNYVAYAVTGCDLLYSMCFLWFMFSFRRQIQKEVGRADADNITADDYTIFVRGLPTDASETMVLDHFSNR
jgi:hypothetical protein